MENNTIGKSFEEIIEEINKIQLVNPMGVSKSPFKIFLPIKNKILAKEKETLKNILIKNYFQEFKSKLEEGEKRENN
jgi:hypothetical protein